MAQYGIPYQGSKSRIAPWVVENLPSAPVLVDLFAGGCAVTHAAMESARWGKVVANDLGEGPDVFKRAVAGEFADDKTVWTRDEFLLHRDGDFAHALTHSFGNNARDYLWSPEMEAVKVPACRMLLADTWQERYRLYHRFMDALAVYVASNGEVPGQRNHCTCELERLQRLQRLQGLQGLQGLVEVSRLDYREVAIPEGAAVYADPPYRGTDQRGYSQAGKFSHDEFEGWLESAPFMVVVSEYTAPRGCVEVAARGSQCSMAGNGKSQGSVERLFVQGRFADEYRERMGLLGIEEESREEA
jgi:hypothetical protein